MKKSLFIAATLIFSLYLTGCARNNVNNDIANRDRGTEPTRVNDQTPGPGANRPGITRTDVTDTRINRDTNRRMDNDPNDVRYTPNTIGTDNSRMRVADRAADKVAGLPEVDSANVIVTYNNAYVAAKLDPSARNRLTKDVEHKIKRAVKSTDRNIDNVYVSVNPDFYKQINDYARDIRNGKPISGFFTQITDAIRRVFPDAK
jgi:spore cortex protein